MDLDIMVDDGDMDWAVIYANLIPEGKGKLLWKLFTIVWKGKRREETSEKSLHPHQHRAGSGQLLLSLTWAPCSLTSLKLLYQHHHHHHPFLHPQFCSVQPLSRVRLFATPMDCYSPSDSSVHGILQARILKWIAILFSRRSSRPRDQTLVSCIACRFFTTWAIRKVPIVRIPRAYIIPVNLKTWVKLTLFRKVQIVKINPRGNSLNKYNESMTFGNWNCG